MENYYRKKTDGINLYLELNVRNPLWGKLILILCILMALTPVVYLIYDSIKKPENTSDIIIPVLIIIGLIIIFPLRYLIWNCYEKKFIVINEKSISYNYNYKILVTNLKTISINQLGSEIEVVKIEKDIEYGRLLFYNYNKETNLPEFIFQTSVLLKVENLQEIEEAIIALFNKKEKENDLLQTFYVN